MLSVPPSRFARLRAFILSGWSFFFRWPHAHTEPFRPEGIFLGPVFQTLVVLVVGAVTAATTSSVFASLILPCLALAALTGLFHEDGFADCADGLGVPSFGRSPQRQGRIHEAMHDPRLGTFGVSALLFLWLSRVYGLEHLAERTATMAFWHLELAPEYQAVFLYGAIVFWSRWSGLTSAALLLPGTKCNNAGNGPPSSSHSLVTIPKGHRFAWVLATALSFAFFTPAVLIWVIVVGPVLAATLQWGLSRRSGSLGGDIIGASICATELFLLLSFQALI